MGDSTGISFMLLHEKVMSSLLQGSIDFDRGIH